MGLGWSSCRRGLGSRALGSRGRVQEQGFRHVQGSGTRWVVSTAQGLGSGQQWRGDWLRIGLSSQTACPHSLHQATYGACAAMLGVRDAAPGITACKGHHHDHHDQGPAPHGLTVRTIMGHGRQDLLRAIGLHFLHVPIGLRSGASTLVQGIWYQGAHGPIFAPCSTPVTRPQGAPCVRWQG